MEQRDKDLLIQDLCGRLPYGVKLWHESFEDIIILHAIDATQFAVDISIDKPNSNTSFWNSIEQVKPYLFPLSSMTEEQIEEAKTYFWKDVDYGKSLVDKGINCFYPCFNILEFYHKYHLDYRGLIPMGLALDATGLNIY